MPDQRGRSLPAVSVVIPTHNNRGVLERCLRRWERYAGDQPVEVLVIEDACSDGTAEFLESARRTPWGRASLRWFHEDDAHELRCDNRGFREAAAPLLLAWQDDMFLEVGWLVPELLRTFSAYPEVGLLSLMRGLNCFPLRHPIARWEDLHEPHHMRSTLGPNSVLNWFRLAEVDIVVRPWVVRRACLDKVGPLDEVFAPVEWDEADLCYRIRRRGWLTATHAYERLGAFTHLGSSTMGRVPAERHRAMVLPKGQLFWSRWGETVRAEHPRRRRTWWRRLRPASLPHLLRRAAKFGLLKARPATLPNLGAWVSTRLGRDSVPIRLLRPFYEWTLDAFTLWSGTPWRVNGELMRVDPRARRLIPPVVEPELFAFLRSAVPAGARILDIGAFLGTYAVFEARWAGPTGRVVAFEPTPGNARIARRHARLNGVAGRTTVVQAAVGEREGWAELVCHREPYLNRLDSAHPGEAVIGHVRVPVVSVDSYCAKERFEPDWIRIDVQGRELAVLRGAAETIRRRGSSLRIVVEMHPQVWALEGLDRANVSAELAAMGLEAQPVIPGGDALGQDQHALLVPTGKR